MKTYIIVTNDKYELPLSCELIGAKKVADFLGITEDGVRSRLHRGTKREKYKIVIVKDKQIDDKKKHRSDYEKRYRMTHDRTEYFKNWYRKKKEGKNGRTIQNQS